jgi:hypothetical protein
VPIGYISALHRPEARTGGAIASEFLQVIDCCKAGRWGLLVYERRMRNCADMACEKKEESGKRKEIEKGERERRTACDEGVLGAKSGSPNVCRGTDQEEGLERHTQVRVWLHVGVEAGTDVAIRLRT